MRVSSRSSLLERAIVARVVGSTGGALVTLVTRRCALVVALPVEVGEVAVEEGRRNVASVVCASVTMLG